MSTNVPPVTVCGIYRIIVSCPDGREKIYIGHSSDVNRRKRVHFRKLSSGIHENKPMQMAWNRYGKETFSFDVIEQCARETLVKREQFHLDNLLKEIGSDLVLNIHRVCVNSRLGIKETDEVRAKLRALRKRQWQDPAFRAATVNGTIAALSDPEYRAKMSAIQKIVQNRPELRLHQISIQKIAQNRPDVKERKSKSVRAALSLPESILNRAITNARPEVRARRSAAAKAWRLAKSRAAGTANVD